MRPIRFIRILRTPSSERFVLQHDNKDFAAADLHFMADGKVAATLIVLGAANLMEDDIQHIITEIDEALLPDQNFESGDVLFTLVRGEVEGTFVSAQLPNDSA